MIWWFSRRNERTAHGPGQRRTGHSAGSIQKVVVNLLAGADDLATFSGGPEISADLGDGNDNVIHRGVAAGDGLVVAGGAGADTFQTFEGAGGTATFDGGAHNAAALLYDALIYNGTAGNDVINVTPTAVSSPSGKSVSLVGVEAHHRFWRRGQ